MAAETATIAPLEAAVPKAPLATVATVPVGVGIAAVGWNAGYYPDGTFEDNNDSTVAAGFGSRNSDELVAVRRTAIAA